MNNRLTSRLGFVAMAFLLATAVITNAATEDVTKAKVVRIKGSARYMQGTGAWESLRVGDVLTSGAVIQTAADSRVDLVMGDGKSVAGPGGSGGSGNTIGMAFGSATPGGSSDSGSSSGADQNFLRLMENTLMSIDKLASTDTGAGVVTDTQLDLRSGRIFGTVKKLSAGSRYEVKVPNGVAGVRGTEFLISADGLLTVLSGSVVIAWVNDDGDTVARSVGPNQQYDPRTDTTRDLTPEEIGAFSQLILSAQATPMTKSTAFTVDSTYYRVSPDQGSGP